jgi:predicted ATPase
MSVCACTRQHARRRLVLTGGPGAGKTAVLEMLRHEVCSHVALLPESAGILFAGGFPRRADAAAIRAGQRAIAAVQIELERLADEGNPALTICDRGVVDGFAYWPGPADFWTAVGITRADALRRYDVVIHLRTPDGSNGYGHENLFRTETAAEAAAIDRRILAAWDGHPRRFIIDVASDFPTKAGAAIDLVRAEIPDCCRRATVPTIKRPVGAVAGVAN